ncbi:hypothetical protein [Cedecea sp. P7760]|uniref:hypothetical protein n=1 Tax=Cedecea sp. P7760 TaxID=2726983 RepID=UPI00159F81CD|nr:hypothetical protein [Cedecea sp. P7760]NWC63980.1 hypothetical protein [Cedecea sp. P7760]
MRQQPDFLLVLICKKSILLVMREDSPNQFNPHVFANTYAAKESPGAFAEGENHRDKMNVKLDTSFKTDAACRGHYCDHDGILEVKVTVFRM